MATEKDDDVPERSSLMHISSQPQDNTIRLRDATAFLTRILDSPSLSALSMPSSIRSIIYINNVGLTLMGGSWQIDGATIYLAGNSATVEPLTRIGILTAIANFTGAIENPVIVEKISNRLVQAVSESIRSTYSGMIRATQRPSRLAINQVLAQVAAEINGQWFTTSGAPVEVNNSWITMDF